MKRPIHFAPIITILLLAFSAYSQDYDFGTSRELAGLKTVKILTDTLKDYNLIQSELYRSGDEFKIVDEDKDAQILLIFSGGSKTVVFGDRYGVRTWEFKTGGGRVFVNGETKARLVFENTNLQRWVWDNAPAKEFAIEFIKIYKLAQTGDLNRALYLGPARDHYLTGLKYANEKNLELSVSEFTKAIQIRPDYGNAYYARGRAYYDLKKYVEAVDDFNVAIKYIPNFSEAYLEKARVLYRLEDYSEAMSSVEKARSLDKKDPEIYFVKGLINSDLGNYNESVIDLAAAIRLSKSKSREADYYLFRGVAHHRLGKYRLAIDDLSKALKIAPDDSVALELRGRTFLANSEFDKAIKDFNQVIKLKPDWDILVFISRAQAYFELGRYKESLKDIETIIDSGTRGEELLQDSLLLRSKIHCRLGLKTEARADEAKLVELGKILPAVCK